MMRILVCGGRDFNNKKLLYNTLDKILFKLSKNKPDKYGNWLPSDITMIHGSAKGADLLADKYAVTNWMPVKEYPAQWNKYGKSAGPIRNKQMIDEGKPDLVIAFPGGRGTANMIKQAKNAGIPVTQIE